jgi:hypothetical protein
MPMYWLLFTVHVGGCYSWGHIVLSHKSRVWNNTRCVLRGYIDNNQIPGDRMVGFCIDGAPSITLSAIWTHCMIYRALLAAEELSTDLRDILQQVTFDCQLHQTTSTARTHVRKTRWRYGIRAWQCSFCYRGWVLERFFTLREELLSFTMDVKKKLKKHVDFLCNEKIMCFLAYIKYIQYLQAYKGNTKNRVIDSEEIILIGESFKS